MKVRNLTCLLIGVFFALGLQAQTTISGYISNEETEEPIVHANVVVEGTVIGTITDEKGFFELKVSLEPPFVLFISYLGYSSREVVVTEINEIIDFTMVPTSIEGPDVTVTASKIREHVMHAPITIETMDLRELQTTPSASVYDAVANLKGVQANTGSLNFTSMNTRGFADMQNWRFVQLIDGMDASAPGLNYPGGANSSPADIDIASIELIPGASSALYGANAFNGLLSINTKNPFFYTGLSAYVKGGVTVQNMNGVNPLLDFGFRYAQSISNKIAFKINFGALAGTDWGANDQSFYIDNRRASNADFFLSLPRNDPNFDAVHVYGDEVQVPVQIDNFGTLMTINRSGIKEADIVDYNLQSYKFNMALHYRISDEVEAIYSSQFLHSDAILRHTTMYPLVNLTLQSDRLEFKGSNWDLKGYIVRENVGDSYTMLATGAYIQERLKSSTEWGGDYGAAFRGEISNVAANDHDAARSYADRDILGPESELFQTARSETLRNPDISTGGSKFVDKTSMIHVDGNYTFGMLKDHLDLQVGGSFRRYLLNSEGQLFNDGINGFNAPIPVQEYGGFLQVGKNFLADRINLRGSIRFDKNQNFKVALSPRLSSVFALDKKKNHNLRFSYQTGFRNPSSQEAYIALDIGQAILLGGTEDNIRNYNYAINASTSVEGTAILENMYSLESYLTFLNTNVLSDLVLLDLSYLKQEKNTTYEIGYKGLLTNKLFIDLNYYHTQYKDFVVRRNGVSLQTGRVFSIYTNINEEKVTSQGIGLGLDYTLPGNFVFGGNYSYTNFDAEEAVANNPGFLPSFNTPKHRFNLSLRNNNIAKTNLGFNIKYRWSDAYTWQSPFGQGAIESFDIVDLAVFYQIKKLKSQIKLGASNLLNQEYRTVYGGPRVGSIYYVSWTFDQM